MSEHQEATVGSGMAAVSSLRASNHHHLFAAGVTGVRTSVRWYQILTVSDLNEFNKPCIQIIEVKARGEKLNSLGNLHLFYASNMN